MKNLRIILLMAAAVLFAGTTAAGAQEPPDAPPDVSAGVDAPVMVCPIGISLGGDVHTDCPPKPAVPPAPVPASPVDDPAGEIGADVDAPVNVCPIDISLGGDVDTDCPPPMTLPELVETLFPWLAPPDEAPEIGADIEAPINVCPITVDLGGQPTDTDCPT
jgi:hypothetical protein